MKRSKQPPRVEVPEFSDCLLGLLAIFLKEEALVCKSREMSMHGSYVVEVNPHVVHVRSDLSKPENTL